MEENVNKPEHDHPNNTPLNPNRRRLLGALVAGGGAVVLMPERWVKPVAEKIVPPAHAQATVSEKVEPDEKTISDRRLKENIVWVGVEARTGLSLYEFEYIGQPGVRWRGVMADEVEPRFPEAVSTRPDGIKAVRYGMLGIECLKVDAVAA